MTQSLVTVVIFVCLMLLLPFWLRRLQQRRGGALPGNTPGAASRLVSAIAVGPQQRVVTIEVGDAEARTWLVLGVTGQTITCLHTMPSPVAASPGAPIPPNTRIGAASSDMAAANTAFGDFSRV
ncbi:MAG: flagellar biosynthetic protein FliO [Variovorax sp.]